MEIYYSAQLEFPSSKVDELSAFLQSFEGFSGTQTLDNSGAELIQPPEEFQVLEFGSESSKKFDDYQRKHVASGPVSLKVYVATSKDSLEGSQRNLEAFLGEKYENLSLKFQILESENYLEAYKENVEPSLFAGIWVGPPWKEPDSSAKHVYFVEPGMAFGTGDHPTTQMCMERLSELSQAGFGPSNFLDLGCGSGILAAHCLRLFPKATAFLSDLDPHCEAEVDKCFQMNSISSERVTSYYGKNAALASLVPQLPALDLVVSNIYSEVLASLAGDVKKVLKPTGYWVLSGVLEGAPEKVLEEALSQGWALQKRQTRLQKDGAEAWVSMVLQRSE